MIIYKCSYYFFVNIFSICVCHIYVLFGLKSLEKTDMALQNDARNCIDWFDN